MGVILDGVDRGGPPNLSIHNYVTDKTVFRFRNGRRSHQTAVTEVVLHETVTTSWQNTVAVLKKRSLGVHFIVDVVGQVFQHADPWVDEMWHASAHNKASVGIELVNPFEPRFLPKPPHPWKAVLPAPWAGGQYVLPPLAQVEAACQLVNWLTTAEAAPLTIPQQWPGVGGVPIRMAMGRVATCTVPAAPGVLAHTYFGHTDGAWPVLYSWLRLEAGLEPEAAYEAARLRAAGARAPGVLLQDVFDANPYLQV